MLACLSEKPAARPTALQVLQTLRAVVEGAPPPGSHHAASGTAGPAGAGAGAGPVEAGTGVPLQRAGSRSMSIQLPPTLPSPFAS